jgi:hypothetical protein
VGRNGSAIANFYVCQWRLVGSSVHGDHDASYEISHGSNAIGRTVAARAGPLAGQKESAVISKRDSDLRKTAPVYGAEKQRGGIGYVFLWLLGVPIPVLILISLLRGCA